jgi:hypothetical protein
MRHVDRFARALAFVLLFFTWTDAGARISESALAAISAHAGDEGVQLL